MRLQPGTQNLIRDCGAALALFIYAPKRLPFG